MGGEEARSGRPLHPHTLPPTTTHTGHSFPCLLWVKVSAGSRDNEVVTPVIHLLFLLVFISWNFTVVMTGVNM